MGSRNRLLLATRSGHLHACCERVVSAETVERLSGPACESMEIKVLRRILYLFARYTSVNRSSGVLNEIVHCKRQQLRAITFVAYRLLPRSSHLHASATACEACGRKQFHFCTLCWVGPPCRLKLRMISCVSWPLFGSLRCEIISSHIMRACNPA